MELPASLCDHVLTYMKQEKDAEGGVTLCCSPRGVFEAIRSLGSSKSTSRSRTSCTESTQMVRSSNSLWRGFFRLWKQHKPTRCLSTLRTRRRGAVPDLSELDCCFLKPSWRSFSIAELNMATDNFSTENLIGKGGYSEIYRGRLESGQLVAVKKLAKGTAAERAHNFLTEMGVLVHLNHPNTAKMVGFSIEGGWYLMLVLSPHGSLENVLHGSEGKLDWEKRYKIAIGTARGLEYLHQRCQRRIIHRDIKAANILLADDFEPQISDFGLSKWLPDKQTHHTLQNFEGTFGYLAPECMDGVADEKTDVFAFGILLLELITGRRAVTSAQQSLLAWTKPMLEDHKIKDLVDPSLGDSYDAIQLIYMVTTARLCIQHSSVMRPRMSQVLRTLTGKGSQAEDMPMYRNRMARRTYSEDTHNAEEFYTVARQLNDINRHKQIAFDFQSH
ncbi:receptor-like cytosolic serine/threonine-protein kinase RBK2 [Curcuma longa]|uniref:receptor-like cytosolic serine/threonine-protein kinase RBK2 n=1 Tax=Curcuma longa TaxID=136217 RepID=UPI003D9F4EA7